MMFLPLIALSTIRLIEDKKGGVLFALSFAALALSHLPSTLITLHLLAGIGVWMLLREDNWRERLQFIARFSLGSRKRPAEQICPYTLKIRQAAPRFDDRQPNKKQGTP